jgi:TonB family protein
MRRIPTILALTFALWGCQHEQLHVQYVGEPEYPYPARFDNLQGTVTVRIRIGPNGNVESVKGSGAPDILVKAAEENLKQWRFGPFPPVSEFPIEHTVLYTYKLQGKPQIVGSPLVINTFLPDRIEISTRPLIPDPFYGPVVPGTKKHSSQETGEKTNRQ